MIDLMAADIRIPDERTTLLAAQPLDDSSVAAEMNDLKKAIQGILAARAIIIRLFRPFIDQRKRDTQVRGDGFRAGFLQGLSQNFMAVHVASLGGLRAVGKAADRVIFIGG